MRVFWLPFVRRPTASHQSTGMFMPLLYPAADIQLTLPSQDGGASDADPCWTFGVPFVRRPACQPPINWYVSTAFLTHRRHTTDIFLPGWRCV